MILISIGLIGGLVYLYTVENMNIFQIMKKNFPIVNFLYYFIIFNLSFYFMIIIRAIFFPFIIRKLGGEDKTFMHSFYILGISSFPLLIQGIISMMFPAFANWQYFENMDILHFLSSSVLNPFNIWSIILLVIGFAKVYNVSYKKASILQIQFVLKMVPVMIFLSLTS